MTLKQKLIRTSFGKTMDLLIRSRFFVKLFLRSNISGTQVSLSSTVVPSKRDLLNHYMASVPKWIYADGPITRVLQISIASLFSGCWVKRFKQKSNLRMAASLWAV